MFSIQIALRTILTRLSRVLIAIAIESWFLRRYLKVTPRKSVEYATAINLLAEVLGIVSFLWIYSRLPEAVEDDWIVYIMVGEVPRFSMTLLAITVIYFIAYLLLKFNGLIFYRYLSEIPAQPAQPVEQKSSFFSMSSEMQNSLRAIVRGHTASYVVILILTLLLAREV